MTAALRHVRIADQVAGALLDELRSGELAARFGVSRTSLRDALHRLELLGHLEVRQGDGTYARTPEARPLRDLLLGLPERAETLLEFRYLLEPEVAALAAARHGQTVRAHLQIADAVLRHDPDGARAAMRAHLDDVVQTDHRALLHAAQPRPGGPP